MNEEGGAMDMRIKLVVCRLCDGEDTNGKGVRYVIRPGYFDCCPECGNLEYDILDDDYKGDTNAGS